jgi:hypothetical protein
MLENHSRRRSQTATLVAQPEMARLGPPVEGSALDAMASSST